jgi:hypothetical protein
VKGSIYERHFPKNEDSREDHYCGAVCFLSGIDQRAHLNIPYPPNKTIYD